MIFAKTIAGDYIGKTEICIGALWVGPQAEKFKGLHFLDGGAKYKPNEINRVVILSEEKIKTFLGSAVAGIAGGTIFGGAGMVAGALVGGKKKLFQIGIEFSDGKKVIIEQSEKNKALKCMLLFCRAKGIVEQDLGF